MVLHVDILIAEIGSTTTVVNAFKIKKEIRFLGQGYAPTTVLEGDVTRGLRAAISNLEESLGESITWDEMFATSSAAGGLKMTVHGLVYDMTVKAAKEAALGAGAVLRFVTAGNITETDLKTIERIRPNIILLAGGVDFGEKSTVLYNAKALCNLSFRVPIIYAGNVAVREEVKEILGEAGFKVTIAENVYPKIDRLNIEPTRRIIQKVFEEHIIKAPGMEKISEMVTGPIHPTPYAVMQAAQLFYQKMGDVLVLDVGGATTDVHSVTEGSEEINRLLIAPEPTAKRTVEGDLGVFVNSKNVIELIGIEEIQKEFGITEEEVYQNILPIPISPLQVELITKLTDKAVETAVLRHVGTIRYMYGPTGRFSVAEGKDLTRIKWIIGTGGALTRLPKGKEILEKIKVDKVVRELLPSKNAEVLIDHDYIMAAIGVLSEKYPEEAFILLRKSLRLDRGDKIEPEN